MKRHYCTNCNRKRNENKMFHFWYNMIKKSAWHCLACMSGASDISYKAKLENIKSIEITTNESIGFVEMGLLVSEIHELISKRNAVYKVNYRFK